MSLSNEEKLIKAYFGLYKSGQLEWPSVENYAVASFKEKLNAQQSQKRLPDFDKRDEEHYNDSIRTITIGVDLSSEKSEG